MWEGRSLTVGKTTAYGVALLSGMRQSGKPDFQPFLQGFSSIIKYSLDKRELYLDYVCVYWTGFDNDWDWGTCDSVVDERNKLLETKMSFTFQVLILLLPENKPWFTGNVYSFFKFIILHDYTMFQPMWRQYKNVSTKNLPGQGEC